MGQFGFFLMGLLIFSLSAKLKQKYRVTYDSSSSCFVVHNDYWYFTESEQGLFYLDLAETSGTSFVTMVSELEDFYSHHNIFKACDARKLQCIIGQPSSRTFKHILERNLLPSCDITVADIKVADHIYGPELDL